MPTLEFVRDVSEIARPSIAYSFCTLVTDPAEYRLMVDAFVSKGFTSADCEFLYVDNSTGNRFDAFRAYNHFLQIAEGRYVVLCHQDILPLEHDRARLDDLLQELCEHDDDWALCGNAGGQADGQYVLRLVHGESHEMILGGPCPARVMSLDENFIIARREANLALSHDLSGFHWYGSDLCVVADVLGWRSYVIDFRLHHKSTGNTRDEYRAKTVAFRKKFSRAFRARWQYVPTRHNVYLSGSPVRTFITRSLNRLSRVIR